jgi:hypothetical protein
VAVEAATAVPKERMTQLPDPEPSAAAEGTLVG